MWAARSLARKVATGAIASGGVAVAVGDVFGDGSPDIIAATSLGNTVRAFNGVSVSPVADIVFADPQPNGGIRLAAKDTDNNGLRDLLVMGTGPGDFPRVERFDLTSMTRVDEVLDFPPNFAGGIFVG